MVEDPSQPPPYPGTPTAVVQACPIEASLSFLGRRWTLTILRDIAFFPKASFNLIRKHNAGLLPRTLSTRLKELQRQDLVRRVVPPGNPRHPHYELTAKGLEVWPILAALFQFGIRNYPARIFADGRARDLATVYPNDAELLLGPLAAYARSSMTPPVGPGALGAAPGTSVAAISTDRSRLGPRHRRQG